MTSEKKFFLRVALGCGAAALATGLLPFAAAVAVASGAVVYTIVGDKDNDGA